MSKKAAAFQNVAVTDYSPASLLGVRGFGPLHRQRHLNRIFGVAEASAIWDKFHQGKISPLLMREAFNPTDDYAFNKLQKMAPHIFNEAMTTGDFTNLTTYVLDRLMMENYPTVASTFEQICFVNRQIKDFRTVERWVTDNGEGTWQQVGEREGFNRGHEDTGKYTYGVKKYEKGEQISWEAVLADDMGQFRDLPDRLSTGGKRTIELFYLNLIAGTTGPHSSMYGAAITATPSGSATIDNRIVVGGVTNAPLNSQNLILAIGAFMNLATAEGRPIDIASDELNVLVGDGVLYQTLMMIKNTVQMSSTVLGGVKASSAVTADLTLQATNWIKNNFNPVFAPELRNIVTTNLATAWWLFAKPRRSRPAIEIGFLTGYDSPQLYCKLSNTVRIGGGSVEEMGDFETMSTEFKGLLVVGGTRMDPRMTMASNGTGS